jgi:hypothetical protein
MLLNSYLFHLRARNLSPRTVKAAQDYLSQFLATKDPLTATKREVEEFMAANGESCKPSYAQAQMRGFKGLLEWLSAERVNSVRRIYIDLRFAFVTGQPKVISPVAEFPRSTISVGAWTMRFSSNVWVSPPLTYSRKLDESNTFPLSST